MDRDTAKELIDALVQLGDRFGDITVLSHKLTDEAERTQFRRKVGNVMHLISFDLLMPIVRQYPEFDPDKRPDGTWREEY